MNQPLKPFTTSIQANKVPSAQTKGKKKGPHHAEIKGVCAEQKMQINPCKKWRWYMDH